MTATERFPLAEDPLERLPEQEFRPADVRRLDVFGAPAELYWLPERAARSGVPTVDKPPFRAPKAPKILADEAVWEGHGLALTPNRFPFASGQGVLWELDPVREAGPAMLHVAFGLAVRRQGSVLLNSTGAAASIPRAHLHIVDEELPFLAHLQTEPLHADWLPETAEVEFRCTREPIPLLVQLRGPAEARAEATHQLLELRTTPAFNLVADRGSTWIAPRSEQEIPAPHFPHALGAAEVWGRWCYAEEEAFRGARVEDLEAALRAGLIGAERL